jgi:hypothetical protein
MHLNKTEVSKISRNSDDILLVNHTAVKKKWAYLHIQGEQLTK